jgi:hypothetical protein
MNERALTEIERLREQFQAETLRTSDLHRALTALVDAAPEGMRDVRSDDGSKSSARQADQRPG